MIPLIDMDEATYLGFEGGLYPNAQNVAPPGHAGEGLERASLVRPVDVDGNPSPDGRYILLSIGMSNAAQEFCGVAEDGVTCAPWTFMGQASMDPEVRHGQLVILNGALSGQDANSWDSPTEENYDRVRDEILTPNGYSEKQVQVVWLKVANSLAGLQPSLPAADADAYVLLFLTGNILRALRERYPNLLMVFVSSRIYGGYATTELNPEPYAYESGLAVKWLIEAQIEQMANGGVPVDGRVGDVNYNTVAPWVAWGPYLWADGLNPRSDGLIWELADFAESDGTHPSESGEEKVGSMLLDFFKTSPFTACWFLIDGTCGAQVFLPLVLR